MILERGSILRALGSEAFTAVTTFFSRVYIRKVRLKIENHAEPSTIRFKTSFLKRLVACGHLVAMGLHRRAIF